MRKLTHSEKQAIRRLPCCLCLSVPPFADGSRCHTHRIVPARHGGEYVEGNVVPLCPPCHHELEGFALILAARKGAALQPREAKVKGGRIAVRMMSEEAKARGRRKRGQLCGPANIRKISPEARRKNGLAHLARLTAAGLNAFGQTPAQAAAAGRIGGRRGIRALYDKLTPAERSANARKGGLASTATFTHEEIVARGRKGGTGRQAQLSRADLLALARLGRAHLTPEVLARGGRGASHRRWHINRGILNPACSLCGGPNGGR
jgi:hypothetical protein